MIRSTSRPLVPSVIVGTLLVATPFAAQSTGELFAPGIVSTAAQETSVTFTADGNTVYFMRSDIAETNTTILQSTRTASGWSAPIVAPFSGVWHDAEPHISPDGSKFFFVSNRPTEPGGAPLVASQNGQRFAGANIWYMNRSDNGWSEPIHIAGDVNRVPTVYNPSTARNGNLYFSAHREDSGNAYQIYVARWTNGSYGAPEMIDLGGTTHNHMDPSVDPDERFLVFAGNEGDSLGSADIYISFRAANGTWEKPQHLTGDVNSQYLENAPVLGRHFGELFVASQRPGVVNFPKRRDTYESLTKTLTGPLNGSRNIWRFDISAVLRAHDIRG